jgi:hypothetical protein
MGLMGELVGSLLFGPAARAERWSQHVSAIDNVRSISGRMSTRISELSGRASGERAEHLAQLLEADADQLAQYSSAYPELAVRAPAIRMEAYKLGDALDEEDQEALCDTASQLRADLRSFRRWMDTVAPRTGAGRREKCVPLLGPEPPIAERPAHPRTVSGRAVRPVNRRAAPSPPARRACPSGGKGSQG